MALPLSPHREEQELCRGKSNCCLERVQWETAVRDQKGYIVPETDREPRTLDDNNIVSTWVPPKSIHQDGPSFPSSQKSKLQRALSLEF